MNLVTALHELASDLARVPSLWSFIFFLPIFAAHIFPPGWAFPYGRRAMIAAVLVLFLLELLTHIFYTAENSLSGYAGLYADTAWSSSNGQPLYTSPDSPFRYSLPYGPDGYLFVAAFQHLLGPSPFSSKLPIFCSWLGAFVFLYLALRVRHKWDTSLAIVTLGMALLPNFQEFEFWPRPDLFLLFFVLLALWIVVKNFRLSWIWLGLILGISVNLKVHGFVYFLPIIALLLQKRPHFLAVAALIIVFCVALLPFFFFHQISLFNYFHVTRMDSGHRFSPSLMSEIFGFLVVLSLTGLAPFIIYNVDRDKTWAILAKNGPFLLGLVLGLLIVIYPASLEGAGEHHLIPFTGLILFLGASFYADVEAYGRPRLDVSPMGSSLVLSQWSFISIYALIVNLTFFTHFQADNREAQIRRTDLNQIMHEYGNEVILDAPGSLRAIETDTSSSDLVFHGMPIGINPFAIMDFTEGHVPEPALDKLVNEVENQYHRKVIWISPRREEPFSETSYYSPQGRVFSKLFVQDFHRRFQLAGHSDYFDIYQDTMP